MNVDIQLATTEAAIKGNNIWWLFVISMQMMNEVTGARVTPDKYAAMTNKTIALWSATVGKNWGIKAARLSPKPAPTESDGAKIPPGIPQTDESSVAANFAIPKYHGKMAVSSSDKRVGW